MKKLFILIFSFFVSIVIVLAQNPDPTAGYSLTDKIAEAKILLEPIILTHSEKMVRTYIKSKRVVIKKGRHNKYRTVIEGYDDFEWKDAALAVMDKTGKITIVKLRKKSQELQCLTPGFFINIEGRPSGTRWNGKNTAFKVRNSQWETLIVVGIKWLETDSERVLISSNGKPRWAIKTTSSPQLYVPYSTGLHKVELIKAGDDYYDISSETAYDDLDSKGVRSLIFPVKNVTENTDQVWIKNLALIEHTDPADYDAFESGRWKYNPYERVLVRLGANGDSEFGNTKSHAGARGMMQFMPGTWAIVRNAYPSARLPDYFSGTADHVQSIKAAVLLYDYNLNELVQRFGLSIIRDPELEYYLAAGYNGGIGRVSAGIRKYRADWTRNLKTETQIYVEELEYLHKHPINPA